MNPAHAVEALLAALPGATLTTAPTALSGGASHACWAVAIQHGDIRRSLVLKLTGSSLPESGDRITEAAAITRAARLGVPVAPVAAASDGWLALEARPGSADPDAALDLACPSVLLADVAAALARLHAVPVDGRPMDTVARRVASLRRVLDRRATRHPVIEWGLRVAERADLAPLSPRPLHRDVRVGNLLVADGRLGALLDWEFADRGDPHEDLGWFGLRYWRRHRVDRPAGGLGDWSEFEVAYRAAGGAPIDPRRRTVWELIAGARWAVIALAQADRFTAGAPDLIHALSGRRVAEVEADILRLAGLVEREAARA